MGYPIQINEQTLQSQASITDGPDLVKETGTIIGGSLTKERRRIEIAANMEGKTKSTGSSRQFLSKNYESSQLQPALLWMHSLSGLRKESRLSEKKKRQGAGSC
jgi:hypothetical protein